MNIKAIYETLYSHYGNLRWWPAKTPYEVMAGAVLVQNTAWANVEKAIANFNESLTPEAILNMEFPELIDKIRPAGFYHQKSIYIKELTKWFAAYNYDISIIKQEPFEKIRAELLSLKGIGKETADSILLYAFAFPTFVVDAYTIRLCERFPVQAGKGYDEVKAYFEKNLYRSEEVYNHYHALIVINGKEHCRKSKPRCGDCPLSTNCKKIGTGLLKESRQVLNQS